MLIRIFLTVQNNLPKPYNLYLLFLEGKKLTIIPFMSATMYPN